MEGQGQRVELGEVEDGDEGDPGLALSSSYSLAQSGAAAGLTHPPLTSAWDTRLGRHISLATLAHHPAMLPLPTPIQPSKPSPKLSPP